MFIDEAKIRVKAGDGGNGCMAFRREKFVPRGGPSGGDGGRGGDVVMVSSQQHNTLIHFRYNPEHKAKRGQHGMGSNCTGLDGDSIVLQVPVGTSLYDQETGELIHDFEAPDDRVVIAKGGRGGRGNQHFATPTHQAPREHELGRTGEERLFRLELKLLADVGLVGFPNAGKSTLISRISAAKPKIADYPFTTLEPNLGVVTVGEEPDRESYVVADMPGLIEGAHLGSGLGTQFLRHIERTRLLLHLVDVSDASGRPDPVEDFKVINNELANFTSSTNLNDPDPFSDDANKATQPNYPLAHKAMIVAATKIDSANPDKLKKLRTHIKRKKLEFHEISAVTGQGIEELKWSLARHLRKTNE
ncbi:MAG: GTPase ObgE [Terracidiphilus sp.]|jgi:GTP-binding protein